MTSRSLMAFFSLQWPPAVGATLLTLAAVIGAGLDNPAAAADDAHVVVPLVRPNDLTGWEYGPQPIKGWSMKEGTLTGRGGGTPLVSGFDFGPGQVQFRWQADMGVGLMVRLLPVGSGEELQWILSNNPRRTAILRRGEEIIWKPEQPMEVAEGPKKAAVDIDGKNLTLSWGGQQLTTLELPEAQRFVIALAVGGGDGEVKLTDLELVQPAGESIFNGRDLTGWWTPGKLESWPVEEGPDGAEIVCRNKNGNYLRSEKLYENFTLSLEYKIRAGGNSGIGIRTPRNGWPSGDGMELQILDQNQDAKLTRSSSMAIYGNLEPLDRADKRDEYNQVVIKAEGYLITAWVNGVMVQHANTKELPELKHRNLAGWIGFQDHGAWIRFRNIRVLEAPSGTGLDQWYAKHSRSVSEDVIGRLMNPRILAEPESFAQGEVGQDELKPGDGPQTLAELSGPGVLTTLWAPNSGNARFALYFDGEDQPRLQGKWGDLRNRLPRLAEDQQPLLAYVPYQQSLRIEVSNVKAATPVRWDALKLPEGTEVGTWSPKDPQISRGLLPALSYRYQQQGWGKLRMLSPLTELTGSAKRFEPGQVATLIDHQGSGVVQMTELQGDLAALKSNDLWLEVYYDGHSQPGLSAPLRMFYPGLEDGKRWNNYLLTRAGGTVSRLAMPFAGRLRVDLRNRGQEAITKGYGLKLTVEPATPDEVPAGRLLAVTSAAGQRPTAPEVGAKGRVVGWVTDGPESTPSPFLAEGNVTAQQGHRNGLAWEFPLLSPRSPEGLAAPSGKLSTIYLYAPQQDVPSAE